MTSKKQGKFREFYDNKKLALELVPLLFVLLLFFVAFYTYPKLPSQIPSHWNQKGEVDNYSSKNSIFVIPIIFTIIVILFFILPVLEFFKQNMIYNYNYYYSFKIIFSIFFATLYIATVFAGLGYNISVAQIVIMLISILFIGIGFILPKIKRNYIMGIRTGWTINSEKVWNKTHKVGGVLFAIIGIINLIALAIFKNNLEIIFYIFMILVFSLAMFLIFYSYYAYTKKENL